MAAKKTRRASRPSNHESEGVIQPKFPRGLTEEQKQVLAELLQGPIDYMDDPIFEEKDAYQQLFADDKMIERPSVSWYDQMLATRQPTPTQAKISTNTPLLDKDQERDLFLQFNFCRFQAELVRQDIDVNKVGKRLADKLLVWWEQAMDLRERIAEYNVALVLAMAKRFPSSSLDLPEMVSEGNLALLRAIDKFQYSRGFKFSTYACRSILKAFSRMGKKAMRYRDTFPVEFEPDFERSDYSEVKAADEEAACADEVGRIFQSNLSELSEIEYQVIDLRFNMSDPDSDKKLTLAQVGERIGLTKERVRQIQNRALAKMKQTLEETYLDRLSPETAAILDQ